MLIRVIHTVRCPVTVPVLWDTASCPALELPKLTSLRVAQTNTANEDEKEFN